MVTSGLPIRNGSRHAVEICRMSIDLLTELRTFKIRSRPTETMQIRIGVHSGTNLIIQCFCCMFLVLYNVFVASLSPHLIRRDTTARCRCFHDFICSQVYNLQSSLHIHEQQSMHWNSKEHQFFENYNSACQQEKNTYVLITGIQPMLVIRYLMSKKEKTHKSGFQ